jgi:hypothetical protein
VGVEKGAEVKKRYYIIPAAFLAFCALIVLTFVRKMDLANNSIIKFFLSN